MSIDALKELEGGSIPPRLRDALAEMRTEQSVAVYTTSLEDNVAGLSSAIALANALKATINAHYADAGGSGEEHTAADTAIASDDADSIASLVTLTSEMQDSYVAHDDDAILGSGWAYHQAQGTERALASEVNPTNLAGSLTVLNDLKAKFNLHVADGTAHTNGDSTTESTSDAAYGAAVKPAVSGVESGDDVITSLFNDGTNNVQIASASASDGYITFTFSAAPGDDAIVQYMVLPR